MCPVDRGKAVEELSDERSGRNQTLSTELDNDKKSMISTETETKDPEREDNIVTAKKSGDKITGRHHKESLVLPVEGEGDDLFLDAKEPSCPSSQSFVSMGFQRKASPFAIKSWSSLALTLDGRDKITKILQYVSRLLTWWFATRNRQLSLRFSALYKSLSHSRKAFRLGRSFIEMDKLRNMDFGALSFTHKKCSFIKSACEAVTKDFTDNEEGQPRFHAEDMKAESVRVFRIPVLTQLSNMISFKTIYHRCRSMFSAFVSHITTSLDENEAWRVVGTALKTLGLLGFWAGDNISYIGSTGFLDDNTLSDAERLSKRNNLLRISGERANQAYFFGSIAGFFVNILAYWKHHNTILLDTEIRLKTALDSGDVSSIESAQKSLKNVKEKQFSLFLALLKSCCDVMVFTNMPGINLFLKHRGKKNNEGLHCIGGIISAGTVVFNNFPN